MEINEDNFDRLVQHPVVIASAVRTRIIKSDSIVKAMIKKLRDEEDIKAHDFGYGEYDDYLISTLTELLDK